LVPVVASLQPSLSPCLSYLRAEASFLTHLIAMAVQSIEVEALDQVHHGRPSMRTSLLIKM
jgi:hypothetical protein